MCERALRVHKGERFTEKEWKLIARGKSSVRAGRLTNRNILIKKGVLLTSPGTEQDAAMIFGNPTPALLFHRRRCILYKR